MSAAALFVAAGCKDSTDPDSRLDENGLTPEINELVPQSLLDKLQAAGIPIYTGATPPVIEGAFSVQPFELVSSSVPGDPGPGAIGPPFYVAFSNQNNTALTIVTDYVNGPEVGQGLGSFIVGKGGNFTVFTELTTVVNGNAAQSVAVISGSRSSNGMLNMHFAGYMVDDNGDPGNYYIPNETGRVFKDKDGTSEAISSLPNFLLSPSAERRFLVPSLLGR